MAQMPPAGNPHDFYTVYNSIDFAWMKGGLTPFSENDLPIRLQRGDLKFGAIHIVKEHGAWLDVHKKTVEAMVWLKLQQSGATYTTEDNDKFKINLMLSPRALMVLRYIARKGQSPFFTVVTVYPPDNPLDGQYLGKYTGAGASTLPVFGIPSAVQSPTISIKKRRVVLKP